MTTFKRNYDDIEASDESPFEFTMGGRDWHCRAADDIPWALVEDFFASATGGDTASVVMGIDSLCEAVLMPDEVEDFLTMKRDPGSGFTYRKFSALLEDMVREVFGTPTVPPASSRGGRQESGRTSEDGSSTRASKARRAG